MPSGVLSTGHILEYSTVAKYIASCNPLQLDSQVHSLWDRKQKEKGVSILQDSDNSVRVE